MGLLKKKPNFYAHFTDEEGNYSCTIYDSEGKNIIYKAGDPCPYVSKPYKEGLIEPPPPPYWDITVKGMERRYQEATEEEKQIALATFRRAQKDSLTHSLLYL